ESVASHREWRRPTDARSAWSTAAFETTRDVIHELRFVRLEVSKQIARGDAYHLRRCRLVQRCKQRFDGRFEFCESSKDAVVLRDAELRRVGARFGPGGVTRRACDASQDVEQFDCFCFHFGTPV